MGRWKMLIIFFTLVLLIFVGGIYYEIKKEPISPLSPIVSPTQTPHASTPSVFPQESESKNIVVTEPLLNQRIHSPFTIAGQARVFENQLNYRLKDSNGKVLVSGNLVAHAPDVGQFGAFTATVSSFTKPTSNQGTVEVFDYSAKDGSEIDNVLIPVRFEE